jgi:hypothetical protein
MEMAFIRTTHRSILLRCIINSTTYSSRIVLSSKRACEIGREQGQKPANIKYADRLNCSFSKKKKKIKHMGGNTGFNSANKIIALLYNLRNQD